MYLLPTSEELNRLWRQIDPKQRFLDAAAMAINELTKDAMPYFDEIEDDIVNMRRDINGFRIHIPAPRYTEYARGTDSINYKGKSFEYIPSEIELFDGPGVIHASSWDEI